MGVLMQQHGTQVAVAQTDLALLSDRAGMVKASRPSPMAAAQSAALFRPRLTAMAVPRVYAQTALSKQMAGCRG